MTGLHQILLVADKYRGPESQGIPPECMQTVGRQSYFESVSVFSCYPDLILERLGCFLFGVDTGVFQTQETTSMQMS